MCILYSASGDWLAYLMNSTQTAAHIHAASRLRHGVAMQQHKQDGRYRFEADIIKRELAFDAVVRRCITKYECHCAKSVQRLLPAADICR